MTNYLNNPLQKQDAQGITHEGQIQGETIMEPLQSQILWKLMLDRQAEMRKEAQRLHIAKMAAKRQPSWWNGLFRRQAQAQTPTIALETSATPKLG